MKHVAATAVILAAISVASCNVATPTSPTARTGGAEPSVMYSHGGSGLQTWTSGDASLGAYLGSWYQAHVEFATTAVRVGDHPSVKFFAAQLLQDATKLRTGLREVSAGNLSSTFTLDATHQQFRSDLSGLTGSAFDRVFMSVIMQSLEAGQTQLRAASGLSHLIGHDTNQLNELTGLLQWARDVARQVGALKS